MKTTIPKVSEVSRNWHLVDAAGKPAGRLAVEISRLVRGKHKRDYTPHVDQGDFVVVINADQVKLTGRKEEQKIYKHYTGYPGGQREVPIDKVLERRPEDVVTLAVRRMLPKNRLGHDLLRNLKVYPGTEHPHAAQKPVTVENLLR